MELLEAPGIIDEVSSMISEQLHSIDEENDITLRMSRTSLLKPRSLTILLRIVRLLREVGLEHVFAFVGLFRSRERKINIPLKEVGDRLAEAFKDLGPNPPTYTQFSRPCY